MVSADALATLSRVALRQHGCWSAAQAVEAGIHRETVRRWRDAGRAVQVLPRVFAMAGTPPTWELRAVAALLWAGGDALLARWSAARVVGLRLPSSSRVGESVRLVVGDRCFRVPDGVVVHRSRNLGPEDAATTVPLRHTTPGRTICDLAAELGPEDLRALVAHAVREERTDATDLRATLARVGPVAGAARVRALADELSPLDADCRSELETRFLRLMRSAGLEPTAMNHPVRDAEGRRRYLDAVWLPQHVAVELDSRQEHGTLLDWHDDLRREAAVLLAGPWRMLVRLSWYDVVDRADEVVRRISLALEAAGSGPEPPPTEGS